LGDTLYVVYSFKIPGVLFSGKEKTYLRFKVKWVEFSVRSQLDSRPHLQS